MSLHEPLVSIVTPVYNGEKYLVECIESVLSQTYQNWDYTIVNNCSTDRSLEIAKKYAEKDSRIKVVSNEQFVGLIENHNIAFRQISEQSKYCKLISADDWIYPECIAKLVELAEREPSVGIVGSYAINAYGVRWSEIPLNTCIFSGKQICRHSLLKSIDSFWTPSAVLYRAQLVKSSNAFYPGPSPSADLAAIFTYLQSWNFGFVHQILSFERIHKEAMNSKLRLLNSFLVDRIDYLRQYGALYLQPEEIEKRREELLDEYYKYLAQSVFKFRNKEFWEFHREVLERNGYLLYSSRLAKALGLKFLDVLFNPKQTIEKVVSRFTSNQNLGKPLFAVNLTSMEKGAAVNEKLADTISK